MKHCGTLIKIMFHMADNLNGICLSLSGIIWYLVSQIKKDLNKLNNKKMLQNLLAVKD